MRLPHLPPHRSRPTHENAVTSPQESQFARENAALSRLLRRALASASPALPDDRALSILDLACGPCREAETLIQSLRDVSGSSSDIRLVGADIRRAELDEAAQARFRNEKIGYVFQFASLLPTLRLIDNVALPAMLGRRRRVPEIHTRAAGLLERLGLGAYFDAYPSEISAGEQRRVAIARALINDPALLLADEPTSDLDEQTEIEIMDELLAVNREVGTTLVLVTHNLALADQAEQIVHIANGAIVA